ncbi:transposase, partial [Magnetospirillum sp. J10]|nr:transposase [Magnetospirillum sulfuroxidans]
MNKPTNRKIFETYVETQLAPTLQPGDVVILDNLSSHKSEKAKAILKERGAWFLSLPPRSQSNRNGLRQAQSSPSPHRGTHDQPTMGGRRQYLRPLFARRMLELPQACRICRRLTGCGKRRVRAPFPRRSEAFSGVDE